MKTAIGSAGTTLFVCFAPYNDPKIAVSVVVEYGGGATAAAPGLRDIASGAL